MEPDNSTEKKIAFEDLSKEELVKKCRIFLTIIQKAKQSKWLLQEEISQLKFRVDSYEKGEIPSAVNELIQDLTQQKLNFVSTVEDLKFKNDSLVTNLNQYKEEKKRLDVEINRIDDENLAYKRQIGRLTDENEQLINHLDSLEKQIDELNKIGLLQQKELLELEGKNNCLGNNCKQNEKIEELEKMLSVSLEEIKRMKNETESSEIGLEIIKNSVNTCEECGTCKYVEVNEENKKLKEKLKNYHSKIVKLSMNIKQLKEDKESILNHFKIYIDQVRDWKSKLDIASQKILIFVKDYEKENEELKKSNQHLKDLNVRFVEQLEAHKTDDEKSKEYEEIHTLKMKNLALGDELEKLKDNFNLLNLQNKTTVKQVEDENNKLKAEIEHFYSQQGILKGSVEQLQIQINQLLIEKEEYSTNVIKNKAQLQENDVKIEHFKNEIMKLNLEKTVTSEKLGQLQQLESVQKQSIIKLEEKVDTLNHELEKSLKTEKQLAEKSGEEMLKLVLEIEALTENSIKLQERIEQFEQKEKRSKCKLVNADIQTDTDFVPTQELQEEVQLLKSENSQLLSEMNEMNQELKERGENLSKLEAHCEEIKKKIQIYETQANKNFNNISIKEETIKELQTEINDLKKMNRNLNVDDKDQEIISLKNEIELLKERINANYEESDVMSSSTISRIEEGDRLRDLEGSWEEKYSKLRNLAIKLKAKLQEQIVEFNKEKIEKAEIEQKLNKSYDTLKILQCQYDQVGEELEKSKKKCLEYSKELDTSNGHINLGEEQLSKMRSELECLKKGKTNTELWKKQIALKVQALRKELEEKEDTKKDLELKLSKLNADLEAKDQALKLETESHRQTKNFLQHFTNENKKNTVLNLEMQDYEKSVKDLSHKLERKNNHIEELTGQIDSQKESITVLREQNSILEETIMVYKNDLETMVNEINIHKKKNVELDSILQVREEVISNLNKQLETVRSQNEELSTELAKDIAERQKIINNLRQDKDALYLQNLNLQQSNRTLEEKLSLKEEERSTISNEYQNYKVRAQSVLRQNQSRDIGLEEKLSGNVSSLMSQLEVLNLEINALRNRNEVLLKDNQTINVEQNELRSKYEEICKEINELKSQNNQLLLKYNQALDEHNETVRSLKVHAETLGQCYRQQMSEQEVRHNREIVELQSKMEKMPSPTEVILPSLPSMQREAGEGSESIDSVNNLPVSLEKLLGDEEDQKVNNFKRQIVEQESKLAHLTELLADTEQDLVKHVQMNKVLKEEIRRQQRAVEREKHAENMEYLKNVIFKFITLNSGDERSRLVPVLNTILKLSPEESEKLDIVAKGDPGLKAWSSYLPMWSSPNKP